MHKKVTKVQNSLDVDVNDIRSLYPKDKIGGIAEWINKGLLKYVDKRKATKFITKSTNLIGGDKLSSFSVVKIIQEFKNPPLKSVKNSQKIKTKEGVIYGLAYNRQIYLNKERINPNTSIHEYTHLWDLSCQKNNSTLWKQGVELMQQTSVWKEVENDPNYSDIKGDKNKIASEVHSRLTGTDGAKLLDELYNKAKNEKDPVKKLNAHSLIADLKEWINKFWYWVKNTQTNWSKEEADKVSVKDFVNMPIADLVKGTQLDISNNVTPIKENSLFEEGDFDSKGNVTEKAKAEIQAERDNIYQEAKKNGQIKTIDGKEVAFAPNGNKSNLTVSNG